MWDGSLAQVRDFYTEAKLGQVVHHCGTAVCSRTNSGNLGD